MSSSAPYLKKDGKGTLYIHWTENRVGKRISTRTKDMARAKEFLGTWLLMDHTDQSGVLGANLTLSDVWKVYDEKHVQVRLANPYLVGLTWERLRPYFGDMPASGLTQTEVDNYIAKRASGKLGNKVKPQTASKEIAYLAAAVKFCADDRRKVIAPEFARKLTLPEPGAARDRWLRTEEIQKMLNAAAKLRRGPRLSRAERFLWLALETAARKQALLDLTWDRVDFETNTIQLDVPGRRKTKKRRATVPISKALRPVLERAFAERLGGPESGLDGLVLDNKGALWAMIQNIAIEAGLGGKVKKAARGQKPKATGISPHVLRHTAATHMARKKVPLYIVADILGNSVKMVATVYGHHSKDDLQQAVDLISGGTLEPAE